MSAPRREVYAKLVRDRIPEIITATGATAITRKLTSEEFLSAALDKVVEEAEELRAASPEQRLDELADVWESLSAVVRASGLTWHQVTTRAAEKRGARGGFDDRVWLEAVEREVREQA